MGNNQSNHFPYIPEKVTWSLNTIINGKSQTLLSDFFEDKGGCTQATTHVIQAQIKCNMFPAVLLCTYSVFVKFEITGLIQRGLRINRVQNSEVRLYINTWRVCLTQVHKSLIKNLARQSFSLFDWNKTQPQASKTSEQRLAYHYKNNSRQSNFVLTYSLLTDVLPL